MPDLPDENAYMANPFSPFAVPAEQTAADKAEQAKVQAGRELLEEMIAHLDEAIATTDSNRVVKAEAKRRNVSHAVMSEAADIYCEMLINERDYLAGLQEVHINK